jgi:hypothetical protein
VYTLPPGLVRLCFAWLLVPARTAALSTDWRSARWQLSPRMCMCTCRPGSISEHRQKEPSCPVLKYRIRSSTQDSRQSIVTALLIASWSHHHQITIRALLEGVTLAFNQALSYHQSATRAPSECYKTTHCRSRNRATIRAHQSNKSQHHQCHQTTEHHQERHQVPSSLTERQKSTSQHHHITIRAPSEHHQSIMRA